MIPDLTALLVLLGLVPGWVFWSQRARRTPRGSRSPLSEVLELVAVGVLTTGVALVAWVLCDGLHWSWLLSATGWADGGWSYLSRHVVQAVTTAAIVMVLSSVAALLLSKLGPKVEGSNDPDGIVWWNVFHDHADGLKPYVGVMMEDGLLIEGRLSRFTTDNAAGTGRDLALASPIKITPQGKTVSIKQVTERVIIPERLIRYINVLYLPDPNAQTLPPTEAVAGPVGAANGSSGAEPLIVRGHD